MESSSNLVIRRNTRHDLSVPARLAVDPEHASVVRFRGAGGSASASVGPGTGTGTGVGTETGIKGAGRPLAWINGEMLDVSDRGAGLMTGLYLPRMTRVRLDLLQPVAADAKPVPLLAGLIGRVLRVEMTDRRPAYLLGLAIEQDEMTTEARASFDAFMRLLDIESGAEDAA